MKTMRENEKKVTTRKENGAPSVVDAREEIARAIAEGFGEYRRQIAEIRARHGPETKASLAALN